MNSLEIKIFDTSVELHHFAAEYLACIMGEAVTERGVCSIALAGGGTPAGTYEKIPAAASARKVDWRAVHFFWSDERCVPPDHYESNYGMALKTLLSRIDIPAENIHRIIAELGGKKGAERYLAGLKTFFGERDLPVFDIILLGMGEDGHIASLFPGTDTAIEETWVATTATPEGNHCRITLTLPVINNARNVLFLITGKNKAGTVQQVFYSSPDPSRCPAQGVRPSHGNLLWLMDRNAASLYLRNAAGQG